MTAPTNADVLAVIDRLNEVAYDNYRGTGNKDLSHDGLIEKGEQARAAVAAIIEERDALRRAFPKPRNRCCMNCAEHGSCNPEGLHGCAYDDNGEDYDRGWNDCLDAALARRKVGA